MNDYQVLKKYLYALSSYSDRATGGEVNNLIRDVHRLALESLDEKDRMWIEAESLELQSKVKNLGEVGALEVLATLGQLVTVQDGEMEAE